jgi:hypothetical protein
MSNYKVGYFVGSLSTSSIKRVPSVKTRVHAGSESVRVGLLIPALSTWTVKPIGDTPLTPSSIERKQPRGGAPMVPFAKRK